MTDEELRAYAVDHIYYELMMLQETALATIESLNAEVKRLGMLR